MMQTRSIANNTNSRLSSNKSSILLPSNKPALSVTPSMNHLNALPNTENSPTTMSSEDALNIFQNTNHAAATTSSANALSVLRQSNNTVLQSGEALAALTSRGSPNTQQHTARSMGNNTAALPPRNAADALRHQNNALSQKNASSPTPSSSSNAGIERMMQAKDRADNAATQGKQEPVISRQVKTPSISKQVKAPSNISVEDRARLQTMAASINKETRERILTNLREGQNKRESKNNGNVSIFGFEFRNEFNGSKPTSQNLADLLTNSGRSESATDKELKEIFGS